MRGVKHFSEVQPKHLGAGVSGTVGGGMKSLGKQMKTIPGGN